MPTLSGFPALMSVGGHLNIQDNTALTSISGFAVLTSVGELTISFNAKLPDVSGFNVLKRIEGNFLIQENDPLTTHSDFAALTHIEGSLSIINNDLLRTISSF